MAIINESFAKKANEIKINLLHKKQAPIYTVEIKADENAYQKLKVERTGDFSLPLTMHRGERILLDFGDHYVGYLHFAINHVIGSKITDSPVKFKFSFGEFPLEIAAKAEEYRGSLGSGWIQREEKQAVFTPFAARLDRRYSFRYLLIERVDAANFPIVITDLYVDAVSSVDTERAARIDVKDQTLRRIYDISLKTLGECEQEVFEDGPKRDRRLWIGDLRLQALTDYKTFGNYDLIKKCIYLFAAYRTDRGLVAPYVFPDSYPYVDQWHFADYSLFIISCIYDYYVNTHDKDLPRELYSTALLQAEIFAKGENVGNPFVDWCANLDKSVAKTGVYLYTLRQLRVLSLLLSESTEWIDREIAKAEEELMAFYSEEKGLFVTASGQISYHSQVWAVLSGAVDADTCAKVLENIKKSDTVFTMRTPYMMHYYIEALLQIGKKDEAISFIRNYWGRIIECGYDCCPEIFNPENEFESPYNAPEINSACHAWSCTPAYWLSVLSEE